jgi:hypothetical protein
MNKKAPRLMHVVWEVVPDSEYDEHLRRVFEILFKVSNGAFDENDRGRQDESTAQGQGSNQTLPR